jgi:hypothetical protein
MNGMAARDRAFGLCLLLFVALRRLNGYNTAEFSRDASLISTHFLTWSTALLPRLPLLQAAGRCVQEALSR